MSSIAIIGGGFSGTMTALNVLRFEHRARPRVVLFERSAAGAGPGLAYGTRSAVHYLNVPAPPQLITSEPVSKSLLQALSDKEEVRISATHAPRGQRRVWLDMARQNAGLQLARLLAEEGSQQARTRALAEALDLPVENLDELRIECFDISHTAGEATQASCVVFQGHRMRSSDYRRYKIEGITGGDDYAAMRQVLERRYGKIAEALREQGGGEAVTAAARMPDLVLVDGGKGQVAMAREVFEQLGLDLSLIVGVERARAARSAWRNWCSPTGVRRSTWARTRRR